MKFFWQSLIGRKSLIECNEQHGIVSHSNRKEEDRTPSRHLTKPRQSFQQPING
ncbi:hypothetical protein HanXRQr2_Chr01g0005231 [Helianthus annuus]|uniref:Uncharacterized protein n=1 Tax=Helianthus annuus TaxID=4232 RepID=A0A9K3JSU0_HELAN|nr:hypothetical protein HanXRQr2_Chr01g0005231 [Helianthus annuus]